MAIARRRGAALAVGVLVATSTPAIADTGPLAAMVWERGIDLPLPLSGHASGISNGALLVAGGTDFPVSLFRGGHKAWYDSIYVLPPDASTWRAAPRLAHPLGYSATATIDDRLIVAGGSDENHHYREVFALRWTGSGVERAELPPLPIPTAMAGAAALGRTIYVVGGQEEPASTRAQHAVWALDMETPRPRWETVEPWPGPARILPVVVAQQGDLYLMSGAELFTGADGRVTRRYLTDAYVYRPGKGWRRIADVPRPVVAAPAVPFGQSHILVFGGDDGANADRVWELKDRHPGFSRHVLAYHTITDTWSGTGTLPEGLVTTTALRRGDRIVIAGGEDRPGHRSAAVHEGTVSVSARVFSTLDYVVLAAYLLPLLFIGYHFSGRNETTEDFFLGGRRIPWWAAGLSIYATQLSAITFLAIPAKAYAEDWVFFVGNLCIVMVAAPVVLFYLPFFRGLRVTTAYEYLERRFNLAVRLVGSFAFIVLQWARLAIVLFLPALALAAVTGINVYVSILLMGLLCTVYTLLGGMRAVIWTDVIQAFVLLGGAIVSLALIVSRVDGGLVEVIRMADAADKFHIINWSWDMTIASLWVVVIGNFLANLVPYTADQAVVQRYLTTRDEAQAARAVWTGALLTVPTSVLFFGVGTALFVFYRTHPALLNPSVQTDATFSWFIAQQLPMGLSGLVVSGVFAAAMSTLSSGINSIATALVIDFYGRLQAHATDADRMRLARRFTVLVGTGATASALVLATWDIRSLWDVFLQSLGLFGGGLAGLFALGIFTRRANAAGVLLGFFASAFVLYLVQRHTAVHFFLYAGIGMISCIASGYVVSLLIPTGTRSVDGLTVFTEQGSPIASPSSPARNTA